MEQAKKDIGKEYGDEAIDFLIRKAGKNGLKKKQLYDGALHHDIFSQIVTDDALHKVFDCLRVKTITVVESDKHLFINSLFPGYAWDRFINGAERIARGERVPVCMDLAVTGRCHCNCWHCFRSKYKDRSDLPLMLIEQVINDAYRMGTVVLGITGGEPMLRDDLIEILKMIPDGMEGRLYSTGFRIDECFIERSLSTRLTGCNISIDHYLPEIANARRKRSSAFGEAVQAVRLLSTSRLYTTVTLCVTEDLCQEDSIRRYIDFIGDLGADEIRVTLPVPQGKLSGKNHKQLYLAAHRQFRKIKEELDGTTQGPRILMFSEIESQAFLGCGAGFHYITVNNDGAVSPCVAIPLSFGNVKEQDLCSIYASMEAFFKSSGSTCYGKRLNRVVQKEGLSMLNAPLSDEISHYLASKCCVDQKVGRFFRNLIKEQ